MQSLTTIDLPFGKRTKWLVTHVDSSGHIFCQLSEPSISVKYERLYQGINSWARAGKLVTIPLDPVIGEICLAKAVDGVWCRCQVTEVDVDSQQAEVFFLDYGKAEIVPFNFIRELPPSFAALAPQANECILANVEPVLNSDKWSERALELIKELVLDQELHGMAIRLQRNILILKLYADPEGTVTVAAQLISAGFGQERCSRSISSTGSSIPRSSSVSSTGSSGSKRSGNSLAKPARNLKQYKRSPLYPEQYIDFCLVFFDNLNKFFCQFVASKNDLEKLQKNLQAVYQNESSNCQLKSVKLNQPCCAKFSEDEQWYRGTVKTINSASATIYFVDYGNTEIVNQTDLRDIGNEFMTLPLCAIECSLSGVMPLSGEKEFSDKAKESFETLTMESSSMVGLVTKVINNKIEVILYDGKDCPINQKLVEEGFVASTGRPESNVASAHSVSSQSLPEEESSIRPIKCLPQLFITGTEKLVYISYSSNPHSFYVTLVESSNALDQLMKDINNVYQNGTSIDGLNDPIVDQPCAVAFSQDDQYYRGVITEIKDTIAKIHYVDYGNNEERPIKLLKKLRKEFIKLPQQAILCKLAGIESLSDYFESVCMWAVSTSLEPLFLFLLKVQLFRITMIKWKTNFQDQFHSEACQMFEKLTMEKNLTMTVTDVENGIHFVKLEEINENNPVAKIDIAQALIHAGMGKERITSTKKRNFGARIMSNTIRFKELKIDVDAYLDVSPVDVVNPSQFCCHVVQNAVDFKRQTREINEFYRSSTADIQIRWEKLMPCVAQYDIDNCWYRATVASIVNHTSIEVSFVDFGNTTIVPIQNLRPIHEDFMILPAQVFVCDLADVHPVNRFWTTEAIECFQDMVLDKHLAANIKSKNENNSYSIVLYDTKNSPEVNISQCLIKKNYAVSTKDNQSMSLGCEKSVNPEDVENVIVTCVTNPLEFWLQLGRLHEQLDHMMTSLDTFYGNLSESDLCINKPMIGQYCCAKFTEDDGWYRAKLEEVNGDTVTVSYIDFGNSENLNIRRIKSLDADFENYPKFALHCRLAGINDFNEWDVSINALLLDKEFEAKFSAQESFPFDVWLSSGGKSLNSEIASLLGKVCAPQKTSPDTNQALCTIPKSSFTCGEEFQMYFLQEATPKCFYCQPVASEDELSKLMVDIDQHIQSSTFVHFNPAVGHFCLAFYSGDEKWYRAQVLTVENNKVTVLFCDYGNTEVISDNNHIRVLPALFCNLSMQAVACTTAMLQSDGTMATLLKSINTEQPLDLSVLEVNKDDVLIVEILKAEYPKDNSCHGKKYKNQPVQVDQKLSTICMYINSATKLQLQLSQFSSQLDELMEKISSHCSNITSPPSTISVGIPCLALYDVDDGWYRAEISNISGDDITLTYIDYGNTATVKVKDIRDITEEFLSLPRTCITCALHDVNIQDIDVKQAEDFLGTVVGEEMMLSITTVENDFNVSGFVTLANNEVSLNDMLYEKFELGEDSTQEEAPAPVVLEEEKMKEKAPVVKREVDDKNVQEQEKPSVPYPDLKSESDMNATCYVVESAVLLRCQLSKYQELLDDLMNRMAAVAESSSILNSPKEGDVCLAKYVEDDGWYRGRIVNVENDITVEFIDFGNRDKVDASSIRCLSAEFSSLPQTCVKVVLNDVHLEDIDADATTAWLQERLLEHVLRLEIVNVENETTAYAYVYDEGQDEHVNNKIYELYALEVAEEPIKSVDETIVQSSPTDNLIKEVVTRNFKGQPVQVDQKLSTICMYVNSATKLQLQLSQFSSQLDELMEKISSHCSNITSPPSTISVGIPCLALYDVDDGWYRAEISNISGDDITLTYIDYGNTATVKVKDIRDITEEFLSLPRTCITCALHDVNIQDIDVKQAEDFLGTVVGEEMMLSITTVENDFNVSGFVTLANNEVSLNDMLYEKFELGEDNTQEEAPAPVVLEEEKMKEEGPVVEREVDDKNVHEQEKQSVPYPDLKSESDMNATCYVVESAVLLRCQLSKYQELLDDLMNRMAAVAESSSILNSPKEGDVCLAKYVEDDGWYRGRIVNVENDITVEFIDFGNRDKVDASSIRCLSAEFSSLPQTCVKVVLNDVHLEDIDANATTAWLQERLLEHVLRLEIVNVENETTAYAYVYDEGQNEHVNNKIYELYALEVAEEPIKSVDETIVQSSPTDNLIKEVVTRNFKGQPVQVDQKLSTICMYVNSATKLQLQLSQFSSQLDELMEKISSHCSNITSPPSTISVGIPCLALYDVDDGWYRAEISNISGDDITLTYIDYGNTATVKVKDIRDITEEFLSLPRTCITCALHDVNIQDIDVKQAEDFLGTVVGEEMMLSITTVENDFNVSGFVTLANNEVSLNDMLYEKFELGEDNTQEEAPAPVVLEEEKMKEEGPVVEREVDDKNVHEQEKQSVPYPDLKSESDMNATCYVVESAVLLRCQLSKYQELLDDLMNRMAAVAESSSILNSPKEGDVCLAKYVEDDGWYRGRIVNVENDITVEFIDFGNRDKVDASSIRCLSAEFSSLPQTCVKVVLNDVHLEDIDANATTAWLQERLLEHVLRLEIVNVENETTAYAYVYDEGQNEHVNNKIYELYALEVAEEPIKSVDETIVQSSPTDNLIKEVVTRNFKGQPVQVDQKLSTICMYVNSATKLQLQLSQFSSQLDELMEKISSHCSNITSPPSTISVGIPCLALYDVDDGWYRAEISNISGDDITLTYIDYGNTATVKVKDIRDITEEFLSLPRTCITCALHDVNIQDIDVKQAEDFLGTVVGEEMMLSITAVENDFNVSGFVTLANNEVSLNDMLYEKFELGEDSTQEETPAPVVLEEDKIKEEAPVVKREVDDKNVHEQEKPSVPYPDLKSKSDMNATCYVVESAVLLRCQLSKYQELLDDLMNRMAAVAESSSILNSPKEGDVCLAKYVEDDGWYRGRIVNVESGITVEFIDFGNRDKVDASNIRCLSAEFSSLPQTCVKVVLNDVHLEDIDADATTAWLQERLLEHVLRLEIVNVENETTAYAYVYDEGQNEHVNDKIYELYPLEVAEEYVDETLTATERTDAAYVRNDAKETMIANTELNVTEGAGGENASEHNLLQVFEKSFVGEHEEAVCTFVKSSVEICCQLMKYEALIRTIGQLTDVPPADAKQVTDFSAGKAVVAKSRDDESWYRAMILNHDENGVEVHYIDFGNTEVLPRENLLEIYDAQLLSPPCCPTFLLQDVFEADIDNEKVKIWLEAECIDQKLKLDVSENDEGHYQSYCHFVDKRCEASLNDLIYERFVGEDVEVEDDAIAEETPTVARANISHEHDPPIVTNNESDLREFLWPSLTVGSSELAVCTVVDDAVTLRCQLSRYKRKLERLSNVISSQIETLPGLRFLEEGVPCIAQYVDLSWYRARVLSTSEATARVEFVDYGNVDDVINEDFRVMRPEWLCDPSCCVKCVLDGVKVLPENVEDAKEYLNRTLVEDAAEVSLKIEHVDLVKKECRVTLTQNEVNINRFYHKAYGPVECVYRKRPIILGEKINITIPQTLSLSEFYCVFHDTKKEVALEMMKLKALYESDDCPPPLSVVEVDMPCCVRKDSVWYRGEVVNVNNDVDVLLVDYGVIECVSLSNIHTLDSKFFKLEIQTLHATLFDLRPVKNTTSWSEEAVAYFNDVCHNEVLTGTVVKYHDDLYSLALVLKSDDTIYELLTRGKYAETKERRLSSSTGLVITNGH